jgi:TonB family protein
MIRLPRKNQTAMNEILLYLAKSYLAGALLFGFYHLLMRKESFLQLNRVYLLSVTVLLAILPLSGFFLPGIPVLPGKEAPLPVITLPIVEITANRIITPEQQKTIIDWAMTGYLAITLAMLGGLIFSVLRIIRFYRSANHSERLEGNIYIVKDGKSPFSFLGRVFIPENYRSHPNLQSILVHENAHISQRHLLDLLILELLSSIFWFNPFFFLLKRAMREVHEYLADREVIRQGIEPLTYQQLLFSEVSGNPQYIIANNFNLLTKKRIVMLIKKSTNAAALRIGLLLPVLLAAGLTIGLAQSNTVSAQDQPAAPPAVTTAPVPPAPPAAPEPPQVKVLPAPPSVPQEPEKPVKKAKKDSDEQPVFTLVENPPHYPGGEEARVKYMVSEIKYPDAARKKGVQGTVYVTFVVEPDGAISNTKVLRGIGGGCDEEAIRVINGMPNWVPGTQRGKAVRVQFNMPIKFTLSNDGKDKPNK